MRTILASLFVVACSSGPAAEADAGVADATKDVVTKDAALVDAGADAQLITQSTTWADGTTCDTATTIAQGATLTIAAGAAITCTEACKLVVQGTLTASSAQTHAKLTGTWGGIRVEGAGMLALDGVDLVGAMTAIDDASTAAATYDHGIIDLANVPFLVEVGAKLTTSHSFVTGPADKSTIDGAFTASYLDYESNDAHAIWSENPAADVFIEDSKFHGNNPNLGDDLVNGFGATRFHVAYTDITGAHCGFHFEAVETLEIDHVTVHGVTNGADLWGSSSTGTKTITNSNFENLTIGFDEASKNGPMTVTGCYESAKNNLATQSSITITSPTSQAVPGAGPR